jgi:hypothetical protein
MALDRHWLMALDRHWLMALDADRQMGRGTDPLAGVNRWGIPVLSCAATTPTVFADHRAR